MRNNPLRVLFLFVFLVGFFSCKKQIPAEIPDPNLLVRFPTTDKEKQEVALLREVGEILQSVYRKPDARFEVAAAVNTGYYEDERVLLKDLLFPESSVLYTTSNFKSSGAKSGIFKKYFFDFMSQGNYPYLRKALKLNNNTREMAESPSVDTTDEIWTDQNGVSIYFPYSENFPLIDPTSPDNNTAFGDLITIVSTDREADSAPGWEPYHSLPDPNNPFQCMDNICYRQVTVDDDYAEVHPTNILGVGARPATIMGDPPPPSTNVNRVFVGWARINNKRQYDKFISFNSANGGGSEIKVCRISGYLQFQNQQVSNFAGDEYEISFKRRDIKRGTWKRAYGVWDPDWVVGNTEQIMAVYEEDNEGTKTFTGSLTTTTRPIIDSTLTVSGSIGYSITVKTQDELILQAKYSRAAYFGAAKTDQGCGFQMCDTKSGSCRYDNTFLNTGNWPIYNCGANWNFTWPYNSY